MTSNRKRLPVKETFASIVETLIWEQVSGSTYVDHGQTVVTIAGHVAVGLSRIGESTNHRSKTLIIERRI